MTSEYDALSEKGKYYFERINHSAKHMQNLINDLLAYSRTTQQKRNFETSNLNKIVKEVVEFLKEEIQTKEATVELDVSGDVSIIQFQFRQLLQNLISNSLKFCDPEIKPLIKIKSNFIKYDAGSAKKAILHFDYYHVSVSDNGIGFDPQFKERIFEIFQRLHQKNTYQGTGIGLTIVKKIVENHNGIIKASSKANKGATFDIYIPAEQLSLGSLFE